MDSLIGKTLDGYQILERIGHGGMATVYKAYQPALDRYVAIKVLPAHLAETPGFVQRFQREAKAVARLEHPHILPIYDFGQQDDLSYLVMRYVEGGTLKELLGSPLALRKAASLIGEVAEALDYAHERGVIHRDVKPSNILLDPEGRTFLTDFGVARILEATQQLTGTGVGIGTPAYMSPEQGQGRKVDRRSDVYSLGVVLYEMLTGEVPYQAETPIAVVLKHINDPLPLPRKANPAIPEAVERVMLKALAKSPEDRFQTARDSARALDAAVREAQPTQTPAIDERPAASIPAPRPLRVGRMEAARRFWWIVPVVLALGGATLLVTSGLLEAKPTNVPTSAQTVALPEIEITAPHASVLEKTSAAAAGTSIPADASIYDAFDDPIYDGTINTGMWLTEEDCSQVAQEDGAMVFRTRSSSGEVGCVLVLGRPTFVSLDQLGGLEAGFKMASDHIGGHVAQHLYLETSDLPGGIWWASCGMAADGTNTFLWFDIRNYGAGKPSEVSQFVPAQADRWYRIRLEVDPDSRLFTCLGDGTLVGSAVPLDSEALRGAKYRRAMSTHRVANAYATTYVDYVQVIPPQVEALGTVPPVAETGAPRGATPSSAPIEPYMRRLPGADSTTWEHLTFNLDDSILGNLAVRQAIAYGTDRQALGDAWSPPYSPVILNSYIRPDTPYYAGDFNITVYHYDPERAKSILAEAGWVDTDGDGVRERGGVSLELRYLTNDSPQRKTLAQAFEGQMRAIGIDIAVEIVNWGAMIEALSRGDFQLAQFAYKEEKEEFVPTVAFAEGCENSYFHSACIPTAATGWKGSNLSRLQNAQMDRYLEGLLQATAFEERRILLVQLQRLFTRELPMLPLFCVPQQ